MVTMVWFIVPKHVFLPVTKSKCFVEQLTCSRTLTVSSEKLILSKLSKISNGRMENTRRTLNLP